MIENKENKFVRYSDFDFVQCSQYKEFNCEQRQDMKYVELGMSAIKHRLYFLMLHSLAERSANESLYHWTNRLGLSKSTAFGIFSKENNSMHRSVAEKISSATGADIDWVQFGTGEAFPEQKIKLESIVEENTNSNIAPSIDKKLLTQAIETAEQALIIANGSMTPEKKAEFISTLYFNENVNDVSEKLLKACISLIEKALKDTRRTMSPEPKSELILVIYNFYSDKPWTEEHLKSALDQLIRSVM
ncbi:hypothetical protein D3C78_16710 [compost metagenome]